VWAGVAVRASALTSWRRNLALCSTQAGRPVGFEPGGTSAATQERRSAGRFSSAQRFFRRIPSGERACRARFFPDSQLDCRRNAGRFDGVVVEVAQQAGSLPTARRAKRYESESTSPERSSSGTPAPLFCRQRKNEASPGVLGMQPGRIVRQEHIKVARRPRPFAMEAGRKVEIRRLEVADFSELTLATNFGLKHYGHFAHLHVS